MSVPMRVSSAATHSPCSGHCAFARAGAARDYPSMIRQLSSLHPWNCTLATALPIFIPPNPFWARTTIRIGGTPFSSTDVTLERVCDQKTEEQGRSVAVGVDVEGGE